MRFGKDQLRLASHVFNEIRATNEASVGYHQLPWSIERNICGSAGMPNESARFRQVNGNKKDACGNPNCRGAEEMEKRIQIPVGAVYMMQSRVVDQNLSTDNTNFSPLLDTTREPLKRKLAARGHW